MSTTPAFEPAPNFVDPRTQPDFASDQWPLCNGEHAPAAEKCDLHERRCLEFLNFYYRLNILNSQLLAARTSDAPNAVIKSLLDRVAAVTQELEATEDRYAPIGFFGDPVMEGIKYRDALFARPELPRIYQQASALSSCITIPGLEDIPASELEGPARILRFEHGKMDL